MLFRSLLALSQAIEKMPHRRRKIVYTAAGDRRDEDIVRQARIIGDFFHGIYIYEDQCTRGRPDGEIMRLMRQGFDSARPRHTVVQESGELTAIDAAIAGLIPGDLLLCQVDQVELALDHVATLLGSMQPHVALGHPVKHKVAARELPTSAG